MTYIEAAALNQDAKSEALSEGKDIDLDGMLPQHSSLYAYWSSEAVKELMNSDPNATAPEDRVQIRSNLLDAFYDTFDDFEDPIRDRLTLTLTPNPNPNPNWMISRIQSEID